jgi:hypothetical protein
MGTAEPEPSSERSVLVRDGGNLLWVGFRTKVFFLEDEMVWLAYPCFQSRTRLVQPGTREAGIGVRFGQTAMTRHASCAEMPSYQFTRV